MTDRRRTPRYLLDTPLAGDAMPMQDVMVELFSKNRLVVIALSAHPVDEEVMIHMAMSDRLESHRARVISCTPVSAAGTLSYRVELRLDTAEPPSRKERTH
jgi:hypothetical protein